MSFQVHGYASRQKTADTSIPDIIYNEKWCKTVGFRVWKRDGQEIVQKRCSKETGVTFDSVVRFPIDRKSVV